MTFFSGLEEAVIYNMMSCERSTWNESVKTVFIFLSNGEMFEILFSASPNGLAMCSVFGVYFVHLLYSIHCSPI